MFQLPRVALATLQRKAQSAPMLWALVEVMRRLDSQVQIFHDQSHLDAHPGPCDTAKVICGVETRYLDSWLMSPGLCRESLVHGALGSDLAILSGCYQRARQSQSHTGGSLEQLCHWLDLPQIALIDTRLWRDCEIPRKPEGVSAVLLDRVKPQSESHWRVQIESLWGVPVLGMLPEMPRLRQRLFQPQSASGSLCQIRTILASQLSKTFRVETLLELAAQAAGLEVQPRIFRAGNKLAGLCVAVAYDQSIDGYFPAVLDLLELQGATVVDFSPLRDQSLPPGAEVVYLGCGNPQRFAGDLAENHCMKLALREHARQGKRIYAEGGGAAYLCQQMVTETGKSWPMVGLLPATAHFQTGDRVPVPQELTMTRDHWLGREGAKLRGYDRGQWLWKVASQSERSPALADGPSMIISNQGVVGSRVSMNFAAQPQFLESFSSGVSRSLQPISVS